MLVGKRGARVMVGEVLVLLSVVMRMGTAAAGPLDDFGIGISTLTLEQALNDVVLPTVNGMIYTKGNALP
eukprot:CAMPEP_0119123702 /NCGR_PEP_ID=MMETSP1310-20130426/3566_1 /TAXON_ID=464262 /ORGANISM="Genus nov. species nov., Strain RCC2339" /LENGTH=69 /DNA_ID=CAMNT_0007113559 /DNA_START=40 /DNA_END=246 /DNA_ORIENTATION=+